ncbi:thioredoxin domain-containing protein [Candidatus Riflebacteria bacterium]
MKLNIRHASLIMLILYPFFQGYFGKALNAKDLKLKKKSNRLINESSLYLLQHAHNPVDWYPWGNEAFERARKEKKMIFLSIGYSSCHWCHVMERESFENEEIAKFLNENFISVKVDREERPDIDRLYMDYVVQTTGGGGWPMTVVLTPQKNPLFGGTYFPPEDKWGRPGLKNILQHLLNTFRKNPDKVSQVEKNIQEYFKKAKEIKRAESSIPPGWLDKFFENLKQLKDENYGGISGAPKFPQEAFLFNLQLFSQKHKELNDFGSFSLKNMSARGLFDHLGGGFFRYSVDERWEVPHFEKMLYNQAGMVANLVLALNIKRDAYLKEVLHNTIAFLEREMFKNGGGFYSSIDADSEGKEGEFYIWSEKEIYTLLKNHRLAEFKKLFGIDGKPNFEHRYHLQLSAKDKDIKTFVKNNFFDKERKILLNHRAKRVHPNTDKKIILGWNALMVSALAKVARWLGDMDGDIAKRAFTLAYPTIEFIEKNLSDGNFLLRAYSSGKTSGYAYLNDYAYYLDALIEMYQTTREKIFLKRAEKWAGVVIANFYTKDGRETKFSGAKGEKLAHDLSPFHDAALPNENAILCYSFLRLWTLTGNKDIYKDKALLLLKQLAGQVGNKFSLNFSSWLLPYYLQQKGPLKVSVSQKGGTEDFMEKKKQVQQFVLKNSMARLFFFDLADKDPELTKIKIAEPEQFRVLICDGETCLLPMENIENFKKEIKPRLLRR